MMRKRVAKAAALITCAAIISLYAPLTYAGVTMKLDHNAFNLPIEILSSIFFYVSPSTPIGFAVGFKKDSGNNNPHIKTTGDIPIHRVGAGD